MRAKATPQFNQQLQGKVKEVDASICKTHVRRNAYGWITLIYPSIFPSLELQADLINALKSEDLPCLQPTRVSHEAHKLYFTFSIPHQAQILSLITYRGERSSVCIAHTCQNKEHMSEPMLTFCGWTSGACTKEQGCATVIVAACWEDETEQWRPKQCAYKGESQHVAHCTCSQLELINFWSLSWQ